MRIRNLQLFLIFSVLIFSCNNNEVAPGTLANSSFELNGAFSTEGWVTNNASESNEAAPDGGNFSLKIVPGYVPDEGYAEYVIEGLEGSQNITLSGYIKASGGWPGSITLKKVTADNAVTVLGVEYSSDSEWTKKTISTTTELNSGDVIVVKLSAGGTEVSTIDQYDLFDQIIFLTN